MYQKSKNIQQQNIQQTPFTQSTQKGTYSNKSAKKESYLESHPKSQTQSIAFKIQPSIGDVNTQILSNHPIPDIQCLIDEDRKNKRMQLQSSKCCCFKKKPDPIFTWDHHSEKQLYSQFSEFIESRFKEVMIPPSINKYYAKIGLQIFIYILNLLELIFTLSYQTYNENLEGYSLCYALSIILSAITHCISWMYSYKLRQVVKNNIFVRLPYYIFYMLMGGLSFFKVAPFIYYFNRNQSIRQFSFSEINKYLILDGEDKFRNPLGLLKKRTKPVNFFRDFIFHRLSVLSMIITLCLQTFPQIFIQGFYNTKSSKWDGFNSVSFIILISNLIYYLLELQFIILTTTSRFMQTELQFKLKKIKLKEYEEIKQLLKADQQQIEFIKSFYFHIDSSKLSIYQKNVCMVYIITFLTRYKKMQNIQFNFIDHYEEVTLQYLANCFKLVQIQTISLLYHDQNNLGRLESIFSKQDFPNLILQFQDIDSIDALWDADQIDINEEEQKVQQILFIENPKINSGWQAVQQNYFTNIDYIKMTEHFIQLIPKDQQASIKFSKVSIGVENLQNYQTIKSNIQESPEQIVQEAQAKIDTITKRALFEEYIGRFTFFLTIYDFNSKLSKLNECEASIQSIQSLINGSLQIVSLIYLGGGSDDFITALIVLTIIHPILQLLSFAVFQQRIFKDISPYKQVLYVLLYGVFNFLKIWDIIMIILYLAVKKFADLVKRDFSAEGYIKFKNYASKFEGSLPISVFSYKAIQINPRSIMQIKNQPFYQAVIWVTDVQEVLNKLPQCFIYLLLISQNIYIPILGAAFSQQIKESYVSVKELLKVYIQDFFIPAIILSTVSVEQFLQSMLYFNSITNQMKLEYPKSFSILSKANERFIKEKCTLKINIKTLDFSDYEDLKREKILAQVRVVLASIESILEIDEAQRLFCMGSEINDFIRCLIVSPIYQLKLNFYLDEVDPHHIRYTNVFLKYCPQRLQFLQLYIEATELKNMQFIVERQNSLRAFSYSYCQIIKLQKFNPLLRQIKNSKSILEIREEFLHLDRYNFEQFYFEISGNIGLSQCHEFLTKFTEMKVFKLTLYNKADIQTFEFSKNINSRLDVLDITFENIKLDFQQFQFHTLNILKMILKKCEFEKEKLEKILSGLSSENTKEVYIDISQCMQRFTVIEQTELLRNLERKKIDVVIKI